MPSRKKSMRAFERHQSATDDRTLLKLEGEAAQLVREAQRRCTTQADELISTVIDAVARDYFRHTIRRQRRRARE
jgi:hypothetical protein